jgi:5-methylcytosine-specific restriction enzyme A
MPVRSPDWARDELILALALYFRHGPLDKSSEHVIGLSGTLKHLPIHSRETRAESFRNVNGVSMKLMNFMAIDPTRTAKGLDRGGQAEIGVWNDFADDLDRLFLTEEGILAAARVPDLGPLSYVTADREEELKEGLLLTRLHIRFDKRPGALARIRSGGTSSLRDSACENCGEGFGDYLDFGPVPLECHHTTPVHLLRPDSRASVEDYRLLCKNCHGLLHVGAIKLVA